MLKIINHKKLVGNKLITAQLDECRVVSIEEHYLHYVMFVDVESKGYMTRVKLHRKADKNRVGNPYKMETDRYTLYVSLHSLSKLESFVTDLEVLIDYSC